MLSALVVASFLLYYVTAAIYVVLYLWARRSPAPALIVALCIFLMFQVLRFVVDPTTMVRGMLWKVLFIAIWSMGIRAALATAADAGEPGPARQSGA
jgi:hypothetical protein